MAMVSTAISAGNNVSDLMSMVNLIGSNMTSTFETSAVFSGVMFVTSEVVMSSILTVTSAATFSGTLTIASGATISGNTIIAGSTTMSAATISGSLSISGNTEMTGHFQPQHNSSFGVSGQMNSLYPVVLLDASAVNVGFTLCAASNTTNTLLYVKRVDASTNAVIITPSGGNDLIAGSASLEMDSRGTAVLYSDGVTWHDFVS